MTKTRLLAALVRIGLASTGILLPIASDAGVASAAQDASTSDDRELNVRAYTELLRADAKAKRVAIITEIMQCNDACAATSWPLFRNYDYELSNLGDTKSQLISDYIKNYDHITNERADELEWERQRRVAMKGAKATFPAKHCLNSVCSNLLHCHPAHEQVFDKS